MPDYPDSEIAVVTDIRLLSTDLAAYVDQGLTVRTTYEPAKNRCTVAVLAPDGSIIAQRVIFTQAPTPDIPVPVETPPPAEPIDGILPLPARPVVRGGGKPVNPGKPFGDSTHIVRGESGDHIVRGEN